MSDANPYPQSVADAAPGKVTDADNRADTPHARHAAPMHDEHDQLHEKDKANSDEHRQETLLDEGIEETFPASDPVSAKRIT